MKRTLILFLLALAGFAALAATDGAASAPAAPATAGTPSTTAQLTVFNRPIFSFRAPLSGISATDRARRAQTRIHELLERPGPNQVGQAADSSGMLVQIDGATAFVVSPSDVNPDQGETLETVAQQAAAALVTVVAESKESRDLDSMLHAAAKALAAAVLMGALVRRLAIPSCAPCQGC